MKSITTWACTSLFYTTLILVCMVTGKLTPHFNTTQTQQVASNEELPAGLPDEVAVNYDLYMNGRKGKR